MVYLVGNKNVLEESHALFDLRSPFTVDIEAEWKIPHLMSA